MFLLPENDKRSSDKSEFNTTAHITLGTGFLGLGKKDEAIREFKIARDLEPQTERGHFSLGVAYREKGNYRESVDELKEAIRIKPKWPDGYYQLGETQFKMAVYHAEGNTGEARKNIEKAFSVFQDFKEAEEARKLLRK